MVPGQVILFSRVVPGPGYPLRGWYRARVVRAVQEEQVVYPGGVPGVGVQGVAGPGYTTTPGYTAVPLAEDRLVYSYWCGRGVRKEALGSGPLLSLGRLPWEHYPAQSCLLS